MDTCLSLLSMIEGYLRFLDFGNTAILRKDEISPRPASLKSK